MKRFIAIILVSLVSFSTLFADDIITLIDGKQIRCNILENQPTEIIYQIKTDYSITKFRVDKSSVKTVELESGEVINYSIQKGTKIMSLYNNVDRIGIKKRFVTLGGAVAILGGASMLGGAIVQSSGDEGASGALIGFGSAFVAGGVAACIYARNLSKKQKVAMQEIDKLKSTTLYSSNLKIGKMNIDSGVCLLSEKTSNTNKIGVNFKFTF